MLANSHFIAGQIQKFYGRKAEVIYPFAKLSQFECSSPGNNSFNENKKKSTTPYLMVGAFAPYKRVDLAVHAFNHLELPLSDHWDRSRGKKT